MKVIVLQGGNSEEREVSVKTGNSISQACIELGYETKVINLYDNYKKYLNDFKKTDIVFNALHGTNGEDGTIQAWFDDNSINYTGSNALSSKVSFDKVAAKIIVDSLGIRTPNWQVVYNDSRISKFNPPYVVKPSRQGSSKGVSIVHSSEDFNKAFNNAIKYDSYAMIEEFIDGREITVGLIDGDALPIVEIKTGNNFYDYNQKYTLGLSHYICPAEINRIDTLEIKRNAENIFNSLGCETYGRVDFLIDRRGLWYFLEMNTLPGMTNTSLLPKAAVAAGISFNQIVAKIISLSVLQKK